MTKLLLLLAIAGLFTSCAVVRTQPVPGLFYSKLKYGYSATSNKVGLKHGKACVKSILGIIADGDSSIETARKNGNISRITYIDHTADSILGVIANQCTVVYGN